MSMPSVLQTMFATIFQPRRRARVFVDAASFDPYRPARSGCTVLLVTCNEEGTIFQRVRHEMQHASAVVVLDQGSSDGTPYFAAEAGAMVVMQEPGQTHDEAMQRALLLARKLSSSVEIIQ